MSLPTDYPLPPGSDQDPQVLARRLGEACLDAGCFVTTAESCTGGGVAEAITASPGSACCAYCAWCRC